MQEEPIISVHVYDVSSLQSEPGKYNHTGSDFPIQEVHQSVYYNAAERTAHVSFS